MIARNALTIIFGRDTKLFILLRKFMARSPFVWTILREKIGILFIFIC